MRNAQAMGGPRAQVAGVEIIRAIEEHVAAAQLLEGGGRFEATMAGDVHLRIERAESGRGRIRLRRADGRGGVDDLAVKVGRGDHVVVEKRNVAYARTGQVEQGGGA